MRKVTFFSRERLDVTVYKMHSIRSCEIAKIKWPNLGTKMQDEQYTQILDHAFYKFAGQDAIGAAIVTALDIASIRGTSAPTCSP